MGRFRTHRTLTSVQYTHRMQDRFEGFLDDISRCFIERDVDLWRSCLLLPFSVITRNGPVILRTDAAVAENFQHYLTAMEVMSVDLIDRRAIGLEDCNDGTWLGTYETRLVRQEALATAPYTSTALLQLTRGKFRMSSILNGRGHSEWTGVEGA